MYIHAYIGTYMHTSTHTYTPTHIHTSRCFAGAIMAVPAHDTRDYEFAVKFGLEIVSRHVCMPTWKRVYVSCVCTAQRWFACLCTHASFWNIPMNSYTPKTLLYIHTYIHTYIHITHINRSRLSAARAKRASRIPATAPLSTPTATVSSSTACLCLRPRRLLRSTSRRRASACARSTTSWGTGCSGLCLSVCQSVCQSVYALLLWLWLCFCRRVRNCVSPPCMCLVCMWKRVFKSLNLVAMLKHVSMRVRLYSDFFCDCFVHAYVQLSETLRRSPSRSCLCSLSTSFLDICGCGYVRVYICAHIYMYMYHTYMCVYACLYIYIYI